ncbi:MAG: hypothetical protein J5867_06275 [Prevotella sp.]|nr:hypothetical protein [Prevotella sp.]
MMNKITQMFFMLFAMILGTATNVFAADPDLENDYTLVKSVAWGDGTDITTSDQLSITAWDTGNKRQQILYAVTTPADAAGWFGVQAVSNGSGKGWWNRADKGLYCYNAQRSAAIYGEDLTSGWLVVFTCSGSVTSALTLTNGDGNPDGTFTYTTSEDGKSYYCTITAATDAYVGFCGIKNSGFIMNISVYKPNKAVVMTTYTVRYVDTEGNVLKEPVTYDGIAGADITLSEADKANITVGDETYIYESNDAEGKTVAEDGSTVVTAVFHKAQNFTYKVNEVANGTIVRTTEGVSYEMATVTVPYRKYNVVDGVLYSKDATNKEYNYSFVLSQDGQEANIDYAGTETTNVVYLSEGEDIEGLTLCTSPNTAIRSSNSSSAYAAEGDVKFVTLGPGTYKLTAIIHDASKTPDSHWIFKAGETQIADLNCTTVNIQELASEEFTLTENTPIYIAQGGNGNMGIDLVYITGDGEVVAEEPEICPYATFDFNASTHAVSSSDSTDGDITEDEVITEDYVTLTVTPNPSGTKNRYWGTANGPQLRVYGGKLTFDAQGRAITKVVVNNGKWNAANTFNGVAAETGEWEGNSTNVVLAIAGNTQINKIEVTTADADENTTTYEEPVAPTIPEVESIAEFNALEKNAEAQLNFSADKNVQVVFVNKNEEKNREYVILQDNEKSRIVLYNMGVADVLKANDVLTGSLTGKNSPYYGMAEMAKTANTDPATIVAAEGTAIKVDVLSSVKAAFDPYKILKLCQIQNVVIATDGTRRYAVEGEDRIEIRDNFSVGYEVPEDGTELKNITGIVVPYVNNGDTVYQITPINQEAFVIAVPQVYKDFAETTTLLTTVANIAAIADEGWVEGGTSQANKSGTIDPVTEEEGKKIVTEGVMLKKGNAGKAFTTFVTGIDSLYAYGCTAGGSDRDLIVTATSTDGDVVTARETSSEYTSVKVVLALDKTKKYMVVYEGANAGEDSGADVVLHGVKFVVAPEEVTPAEFSYRVESYVGSFYEGMSVEVDYDAIIAAIGATAETLAINAEASDGTRLNGVRGETDGWYNNDGMPMLWAEQPYYYVQDNPDATPIGKYYWVGGYPGHTAEPVEFTGKIVYTNTATGAEAYVYITLAYVEAPKVEFDIVSTVSTAVTYSPTEGSYTEKVVSLTEEQIASICTALGISTLAEGEVYGYNPSTEEFVSAYASFDGWRDANGDFANWTGNAEAPACVKIYDDGAKYYCYNIGGTQGQYKTYWAITKDGKAALVEVVFSYLQYTVGTEDLSDGYLGDSSQEYTVQSGQTAHFEFTNHSKKDGFYQNWILVAKQAGDVKMALRADNWENIQWSNENCVSDYNWDTFMNDMDGAYVVLDATYQEGLVTTNAVITTVEGVVYHYSFTKQFADAPEELVFQLSEEAAYLEVYAAEVTGEYVPTAINKANVAEGVETIFDLNGRRVNSMKKGGLYIINGKKVLVK